MNRYLLVLFALVAAVTAYGAESPDTDAPRRLSDIVKAADYVVLDFGDYGRPREVRSEDRKYIAAIARVFADATYFRRDHSLSVSPAMFAFYVKGKLRMAVSLQPESVIRLSNTTAEENFEVDRKTIDALRDLYQSKRSQPAGHGHRP